MINKNLKKIFGNKIPSHFKRKDNLRPVDLTPEEYLIIAKVYNLFDCSNLILLS